MMKIQWIIKFFNVLNWFLSRTIEKDNKQIDKNRQKRKALKAAISKVNDESKRIHQDRQLAERIKSNVAKITE
ncbi:hypothetical protein CPT_Phriendly_009 [Vibrio phage Phriendly]|nr:hypothetical protein CPT_Phriendly_009 [Vibrio phage Phriendly]